MLLAAGPTRRDGPRCSSASRHPCDVEGSAVRNVEESLAHGVHHGVHAGAHLELLQNVAHVVLDGVLADEQPLADLPVVQTPARRGGAPRAPARSPAASTPAAHRSGTTA